MTVSAISLAKRRFYRYTFTSLKGLTFKREECG
jgi:hypothetical protein